MIDRFIVARERGTPLITIKTFDAQLTIASIQTSCSTMKDGQPAPIFVWDCIRGIRGINSQAEAFCKQSFSEDSTNAVTALEMAVKIPERSIFICMNAHRGIVPDVNSNWVQAVWNLRGTFKTSLRMLVLLCPDVIFPPELAQDITVLDEPLPNSAQLRKIVLETFQSVKEDTPETSLVDKAVDAIAGLSVFAAEQVAAMSLRRDSETKKISLDLEELWSRKAQMIQQTPGLSVYKGKETFDKIGGYTNVKTFLTKIINGKRKPNGLVFIDEIEKAFAGATSGTSDSSGVSQGFLGTLLSYMQDNECSGIIAIGPPGTSKSMFAKAFANTAEIPCISFDLTGMKQSLVGSSEANLRNALKVVTAVTQGKTFVLATCLATDTVVQRNDGGLMSLGDSYSPILSTNMDYGYLFAEKPSAKIHKKVTSWLHIKLSGAELKSTPEHKFFRFIRGAINEVRADQLKRGDFVASARNLPGGSDSVNSDLAYLVGYTCGDGGRYSSKATGHNRIQWSEWDLDQCYLISEICLDAFGKRPGIHNRKSVRSRLVYLDNKAALEIMDSEFFGVLGPTINRRVPITISTADQATVASFISGLFDADGTCGKTTIGLTTISPTLAHQMIMLLLRFGIQVTLTSYKKNPNDVYTLSLSGENAANFALNIGFRMKRKQDAALKLVQGNRLGYNTECVPFDKEFLKSFCPPGIFQKVFGVNNFASIQRNNFLAGVSKLSAMGIDVSELLLLSSFRWQKVKRILKMEAELEVCDITMPTNHTFIANGVISHNCNRIAALPPELRRRFKSGTFFFDLPGREERAVIWNIYRNKFDIPSEQTLPDDEGWSGAEIQQCCYLASEELCCTLMEAAQYIVPVAKSAEKQIQELRVEASGRFISASYPGYYKHEGVQAANETTRLIGEIGE